MFYTGYLFFFVFLFSVFHFLFSVLFEGCFWLQQKPIFRNPDFGGNRFCCFSGINFFILRQVIRFNINTDFEMSN